MFIKATAVKIEAAREGNSALVTVEFTGDAGEKETIEVPITDPGLLPQACRAVMAQLNHAAGAKSRLAQYVSDNKLGEVDLAATSLTIGRAMNLANPLRPLPVALPKTNEAISNSGINSNPTEKEQP